MIKKRKRKLVTVVTDEQRVEVARRVRKLMAENDLTVSQAVRTTGLSRWYLSRIRQGKSYPSHVHVARRLAAALNTTIEELLYGD